MMCYDVYLYYSWLLTVADLFCFTVHNPINVMFITICIIAMAGNIVPAIASTNAVVGGIIVMEALHIICSNLNQCKAVRH